MILLSASAAQLPLHDIVDEYQISWWPLAIGWWLLIIAGIVLTALIATQLVLYHRTRRGYSRIEALLKAEAQSLTDISLRLKQVLLLKHPRMDIAKSDIHALSDALLSKLPQRQQADFSASLMLYLERQYQPQDPAFVTAYQEWSIQWWQQAKAQFRQEARHV